MLPKSDLKIEKRNTSSPKRKKERKNIKARFEPLNISLQSNVYSLKKSYKSFCLEYESVSGIKFLIKVSEIGRRIKPG